MTDREFDQKVRSLLANAGEPAPDGAWDAIRARIPAKAAKTAAPWWWAGAGLVAAAAVAAALVLGGTFRSDPSVVTTGEGPVVAQVTEPAAEAQEVKKAVEAEFPQNQSIPAEAGPTYRPVKRAANTGAKFKTMPDGSQSATTAPAAAPAKDASAAPGVESATTKSAPAAKPAEKAPAAKTAEKKEVSEKTVDGWSDPFARMAWEDAHSKTRRGVSLEVKGLVGTNDKATAALRGGMMAVAAKAQSETGKTTYITEEGESRYGIPLSFGLGAKFYLSDRWALGTGVSYSLLMRSFPGSYTKEGAVIKPVNSNIKHTIQYIGIPVNLYYDFVSNRVMTMYAFAGGSVEKGIVQKYTIPGSGGTEVWKQNVPGLQGSAALGLGVQMKLSDNLGFYVDPSARYYFGANQPKSIRTQQNVMFNLELGVRFDL
jgi:hypothetical protein